MPALVGFPDTPPLGELAYGGAWERCEWVEGGETVSCDGTGEDDEVGGKGAEDGRKRGGKVGEENDGPKRRDREYCGQDWLWGLGLMPVEEQVGELWGSYESGWGRRAREMLTRLEMATQMRGRMVTVRAWGEGGLGAGGVYIRNGTRRLGDGFQKGMAGENDMMSSASPIRGASSTKCVRETTIDWKPKSNAA